MNTITIITSTVYLLLYGILRDKCIITKVLTGYYGLQHYDMLIVFIKMMAYNAYFIVLQLNQELLRG